MVVGQTMQEYYYSERSSPIAIVCALCGTIHEDYKSAFFLRPHRAYFDHEIMLHLDSSSS